MREASTRAESRLRALLVAALDGDESAYRSFLSEAAAHLRAFFRGRLRALPDYVEDLVQETLLALHNQRHTYDADQPVTAWVHAIARYKMIDLLRRRAVREALDVPLDDDAEIFASYDTHVADARRDVLALLERLPELQRLAIVYTKLDELSVSEAAARIGTSVSNVKVSVHRGLKTLSRLMRQRT
jgi:RNA polymerase sigma-70 factor (ECF subfamily)